MLALLPGGDAISAGNPQPRRLHLKELRDQPIDISAGAITGDVERIAAVDHRSEDVSAAGHLTSCPHTGPSTLRHVSVRRTRAMVAAKYRTRQFYLRTSSFVPSRLHVA
jgi:hypothetical protein